ncbi:MAG TPA: TlpA disulfide reductase family protein [Pyrinomonadaceae bacterium]|nr:TlpA disulfide reductase family protein [Pyrinomonadaceae bacterium]
MTSLIRTTHFGALALVLISSLSAQRVPTSHAARTNDVRARTPAASHVNGAQREQQSGEPRKTAKTTSSSAPAVREIDLAGLKKLLKREGKEGRPLLVNFWATWCEPCRTEFPDLIKIDDEYRGRGLDFITVSIDEVSEINTTVPSFLKEMRARMPAYLLNTIEQDAAIQFVDPQWSGSLPATFLYDAQGKVVFKHMGRIKPDELRAAINKVMSAK